MTTVYEALKQSLNTVAVRVGDMVTPRTMFEFARDTLGITTLDENSDVDLALSLIHISFPKLKTTKTKLFTQYNILV